jgi:peptidoglycan/xylan/chitin deacetylase (PgdA/CDA1 family)
MYHQISERNNCGDYVLSLNQLRCDFQYFSDNNITPISFRQLREFTEKGTTLPQKPVIITFDDGCKSFLTKVVPLLEEYNYPANINIIGSLTELYTQNGDTNDHYAYLNAEDIMTLSAHPLVEIGCHTYNLHNLSGRRGMSKLTTETEDEYIAFIKKDIEAFDNLYYEITGDKLTVFAYPYGIKNDILPQILQESGYKIILTSGERINKFSHGSKLTEIGRFNRPHGIESDAFFRNLFPIAKE